MSKIKILKSHIGTLCKINGQRISEAVKVFKGNDGCYYLDSYYGDYGRFPESEIEIVDDSSDFSEQKDISGQKVEIHDTSNSIAFKFHQEKMVKVNEYLDRVKKVEEMTTPKIRTTWTTTLTALRKSHKERNMSTQENQSEKIETPSNTEDNATVETQPNTEDKAIVETQDNTTVETQPNTEDKAIVETTSNRQDNATVETQPIVKMAKKIRKPRKPRTPRHTFLKSLAREKELAEKAAILREKETQDKAIVETEDNATVETQPIVKKARKPRRSKAEMAIARQETSSNTQDNATVETQSNQDDYPSFLAPDLTNEEAVFAIIQNLASNNQEIMHGDFEYKQPYVNLFRPYVERNCTNYGVQYDDAQHTSQIYSALRELERIGFISLDYSNGIYSKVVIDTEPNEELVSFFANITSKVNQYHSNKNTQPIAKKARKPKTPHLSSAEIRFAENLAKYRAEQKKQAEKADNLLEKETQDKAIVETQPNTEDKAIVETTSNRQDHITVETQDKAIVETQDKAIVETQDKAIVETQDKAIVETQDKAIVETQDKAIVETQDKAIVETQPNTEDNATVETPSNRQDNVGHNKQHIQDDYPSFLAPDLTNEEAVFAIIQNLASNNQEIKYGDLEKGQPYVNLFRPYVERRCANDGVQYDEVQHDLQIYQALKELIYKGFISLDYSNGDYRKVVIDTKTNEEIVSFIANITNKANQYHSNRNTQPIVKKARKPRRSKAEMAIDARICFLRNYIKERQQYIINNPNPPATHTQKDEILRVIANVQSQIESLEKEALQIQANAELAKKEKQENKEKEKQAKKEAKLQAKLLEKEAKQKAKLAKKGLISESDSLQEKYVPKNLIQHLKGDFTPAKKVTDFNLFLKRIPDQKRGYFIPQLNKVYVYRKQKLVVLSVDVDLEALVACEVDKKKLEISLNVAFEDSKGTKLKYNAFQFKNWKAYGTQARLVEYEPKTISLTNVQPSDLKHGEYPSFLAPNLTDKEMVFQLFSYEGECVADYIAEKWFLLLIKNPEIKQSLGSITDFDFDHYEANKDITPSVLSSLSDRLDDIARDLCENGILAQCDNSYAYKRNPDSSNRNDNGFTDGIASKLNAYHNGHLDNPKKEEKTIDNQDDVPNSWALFGISGNVYEVRKEKEVRDLK